MMLAGIPAVRLAFATHVVKLPSPQRDEVDMNKFSMAFTMTIAIGVALGTAQAAPKKAPAKRSAKVAKYGGEALKRKTIIRMDGRTVEGLTSNRFDSTVLNEGDESQNKKRLYSLPANFSSQASSTVTEMRYRQ
jgi:hypothetical protein